MLVVSDSVLRKKGTVSNFRRKLLTVPFSQEHRKAIAEKEGNGRPLHAEPDDEQHADGQQQSLECTPVGNECDTGQSSEAQQISNDWTLPDSTGGPICHITAKKLRHDSQNAEGIRLEYGSVSN